MNRVVRLCVQYWPCIAVLGRNGSSITCTIVTALQLLNTSHYSLHLILDSVANHSLHKTLFRCIQMICSKRALSFCQLVVIVADVLSAQQLDVRPVVSLGDNDIVGNGDSFSYIPYQIVDEP